MYREDWAKGYDTALRAYRLANEEIPDLRFVTFGSHPRHQHTHLPADVEYHAKPTDRELADLYGACTAWLFASRREGYGLPILEAMACRTPVIATRAGAAPELIERGGGWLVEVEDARAMADAIIAACRLSPEAWLEASDAAYESVRGYTWADAGDAFAAALERAASRRHPGRGAQFDA
jgi:glycosyltransferase involved in cell wall biosynthesis